MRVLFLAFGGTRRQAVVDESARVVAAGGDAVVLIDHPVTWRRSRFAPGVTVVPASHVEGRHLPRRVGRAFVYHVPSLIFEVLGRGPIRRAMTRAARAYEREVAVRVDRGLVLPFYRRAWRHGRACLFQRHVASDGPIDLMVVSDPASIRDALALSSRFRRDGQGPRLVFSLSHATIDPS